MDNHIKIF